MQHIIPVKNFFTGSEVLIMKFRFIGLAAAYVASAWRLIQVAETLFPLFGYGDTPARIVIIVLAIGIIPARVYFFLDKFVMDPHRDAARLIANSTTFLEFKGTSPQRQ